MPTPQEPTEREVYLAQLSTSDEDPEALLAGGADVDDLIAAGVLSDDEPVPQEEVEVEISPSTLSEEEVRNWFAQQREWFAANGHDYRTVQV